MAQLFLVATSNRPQDETESSLMKGLMQKHCTRMYEAGDSVVSNQSSMVEQYAFFMSEFITKCYGGNLMKIAEEYFGVSEEEYWKLYKKWSERDDRVEEQIKVSMKRRLEIEKEYHGYESMWPRCSWVLDHVRTTEVAE